MLENKKILALIPARAGSKGVKYKNFRKLNGKPLISYTIDRAKEIKDFLKIVVSTDDPHIAKYSLDQGVCVPFLRPQLFSGDEVPMWKVIDHALRYFQNQGQCFDFVCLLQPTVPFREKSEIESALELFCLKDADTVTTVSRVPDQFHPYWLFSSDENYKLKHFSEKSDLYTRRQALPPVYQRNGSVYVIKSNVILNEHKIFGSQAYGLPIENAHHVNIDTEEDWSRAVAIAEKLNN